MGSFSLFVAFVGGLVSFLSPCILPIVPGFLAYLAGVSFKDAGERRRDIFLNSVYFVLGFSFVFATLGILLNTILATVAYDLRIWLARIGGVLIIFFGLYLTKLVRIPFLEREYKFKVNTRLNSRFLTSFSFGAALAAGWTPCVGAALGGILGLAATAPGMAFALLLSYSFGLGVPFLAVGLFTSQAADLITRYAKWFEYVSIVFGIILIILGVLAFTQNLSLVVNIGFLNNFLLQQ